MQNPNESCNNLSPQNEDDSVDAVLSADPVVIRLSPEAWAAFVERLNAPVRPKPALTKLFSEAEAFSDA